MNAVWLVLAIAALAAVYVWFPVAADVYYRLRGKRILICPEARKNAEVRADAGQAALTAAFSRPRVRVKSCSLWPARLGCGESCLAQIEEQSVRPAEATHR
jgi:hypothetical protein